MTLPLRAAAGLIVGLPVPLLYPEAWTPGTGFAFQALGQPGRPYRAEWSTNLLDWVELEQGEWISPSVRIVDAEASKGPAVFYRVAIVP